MSAALPDPQQLRYQTAWSEYQQRYIATVSHFRSLTVLAASPDEALATLHELVQAIMDRRGAKRENHSS